MFELGRISKNPEFAGSHEPRGYWPEVVPGIRGSKLGMQAYLPCAWSEPLLLVSGLSLIRAGLAEAREATEELQQRTLDGSNSDAQFRTKPCGRGLAGNYQVTTASQWS